MEKNDQALRVLRTILYVLAGVILLIGLAACILLLASAANLPSSLMGLRVLGFGPLTDAIAGMLSSALVTLAAMIFIIALILAVLLFAGGKLVERAALANDRLRQLERRLDETTRRLDGLAPPNV